MSKYFSDDAFADSFKYAILVDPLNEEQHEVIGHADFWQYPPAPPKFD